MKADYPLRFISSVVNECQKGKECGEHFLKKFLKFTNNSLRIAITWKTRYIRSLFPLKDKKDYKLCIFL